MTQPRDDLALVMLAAWLNVRPDQIPAENRAHTCAATMAAWQRVADAARAAIEAERAARDDRLRQAVKRHLEWLNNLPVPTTGRSAQIIQLRAALSASEGRAAA